MERVLIKVLPNPENPELAIKYVGAKEYIPAGVGEDGKTITGLDENALHVLRIEDPAERKKVQTRIKKERDELERLLNRDLDVNSEFWDDFFVVLEDELELEPSNPMHRLIEIVLVANKKVAPSRDAIETDEDFMNCMFYIFRENDEISKKAKKELDRDKVVSKLFILSEENPRKLIGIYSYLFGYNAEIDMSPDKAYTKIKELLETGETDRIKSNNLKRILEAIDKSPEELGTKLILDKAIKKKVIAKKGGAFRRGDVLLGNTYEETLEYLLSPEQSSELISLKKEVDKL